MLSSGSLSSDESGQEWALPLRGARTFVRVKLLEVVLPKGGRTLGPPARIRTMTALRQFGRSSFHHEDNYINHIAAAAMA